MSAFCLKRFVCLALESSSSAFTSTHSGVKLTPMSNTPPTYEYILLSRGQWDPHKSKEEIQSAIDEFYIWHERLVSEGKLRPGNRLATETKWVTQTGIIDGPFTETKEVIGGYWFIVASSLQEAAAIAAESPCLACGLFYEIRPLELERGSAYRDSVETPNRDVPRGVAE
jgi:hypothetical protein